jgi:hypothetical protein
VFILGPHREKASQGWCEPSHQFNVFEVIKAFCNQVVSEEWRERIEPKPVEIDIDSTYHTMGLQGKEVVLGCRKWKRFDIIIT